MAPVIAQVVLPLVGGFTNSTVTVPVPPVPPGATHAIVRIDHRARYFYGLETDLVVNEGLAWCQFRARARVVQGWSLHTGGVEYPGDRSSAHMERFGGCAPFDGVNDWGGSSGWNSGYLWRPTAREWRIPVAALGDTLAVTTRARSFWDQAITCQGVAPAWSATGSLLWLNESWWEGEATVSFR